MAGRVQQWYNYAITQGFKWTPINRKAHSGIDLGVPWGHTVTAPIDGMISFAACKPWGGQVDVTGYWQGDTYTATVLHLHEILVHNGQRVQRGDILGYSGGDGRGPCATARRYSNGPHVHLELTYGTLGPYHGGPPYTISARSYTVSPAFLLEDLRGNASEAIPPDQQARDTTPPFQGLFGLPSATVAALDAIPGIDNLIYRLHEVETFPGWRSVDEVATDAALPVSTIPDININLPGVTVDIPLSAIERLNPARVGYWLVGNTFGNMKAGSVRFVYLMLGLLLLTALAIAAADAMLEQQLDTGETLAKDILPFAAMAG